MNQVMAAATRPGFVVTGRTAASLGQAQGGKRGAMGDRTARAAHGSIKASLAANPDDA